MLSMTGYGVATAQLGGAGLRTEVRSLNHRFLEVRVRLANELVDHTFYVEQRCRELLNRGRYDVCIRLEGASAARADIDLEQGRAAYAALCRLRDEVAPDSEVPLSLLAAIPSLLSTELRFDPEQVRQALNISLQRAVEHLNQMRRAEGNALLRVLEEHLERAVELKNRIAQRAPDLVHLFRQRLTERLERLLNDRERTLDPGRLEMEVALLADKSDISEELSRLSCHFDQFRAVCHEDKPVGRRLDFLLQEIAREANTVGAKCPDATISHLVVELKAEIERIREQVQNVE